MRSAAPVFAALGDPTRLHLVQRLCEHGPMSTQRLGAGARMTRQAVAKHLDALSAAGLVRGRRRGRERIWELEPAPLAQARGYLDQISRRWDAVIDRLRAFVEAD